jgi:DNA-directed RNA polymerase subunit beta'
MIVREDDCKSDDFITVKKSLRSDKFIKRITGRVVAADVVVPKSKKVIVAKGDLIDKQKAERIDKEDIENVLIRSPLACITRHGVCAKCYGWDLSNKKAVELGTPVGVIAAQSIGEPGTQLTLRTHHTGGVVGLDVTQGLPRVEELFEARTPRVFSPITEIAGRVKVEEKETGWEVTVKTVSAKPKEEREYLVPKTLSLIVNNKQLIDAGMPLATGPLDIKEILTVRGLRITQEYLVGEIQKVYESQGIPIDDKHFEIIVKKMSDEVRIITSGDTPFLINELVDKATFEEENEKVLAAGGEPASAQQVILGITRRALYTQSWLSAASFEQTIDVLTDASLMGKEDRLLGLKENVIIGRLVPVSPDRAVLTQG